MTLHDARPTDTALANDEGPPRPPPSKSFSIKWAMVVPGIGLLILALFIGAAFLTSNPAQVTKDSTRAFSVAGTSLRAEPAEKDLKVITVSGQPPANIVNTVAVPVGAKRVSQQNNTATAQEYDAQIGLTTDASQGAVANFYSKVLKKEGWQVFSSGPADHDPGGIEVLAKKAGSDGFYWELGAVVSATTFGPQAPPTGRTAFALELFQVPDPD